jgi:hypothetical protein
MAQFFISTCQHTKRQVKFFSLLHHARHSQWEELWPTGLTNLYLPSLSALLCCLLPLRFSQTFFMKQFYLFICHYFSFLFYYLSLSAISFLPSLFFSLPTFSSLSFLLHVFPSYHCLFPCIFILSQFSISLFP